MLPMDIDESSGETLCPSDEILQTASKEFMAFAVPVKGVSAVVVDPYKHHSWSMDDDGSKEVEQALQEKTQVLSVIEGAEKRFSKTEHPGATDTTHAGKPVVNETLSLSLPKVVSLDQLDNLRPKSAVIGVDTMTTAQTWQAITEPIVSSPSPPARSRSRCSGTSSVRQARVIQLQVCSTCFLVKIV